MKKFHNHTHKIQSITFHNGDLQYLFSNESIITNKKVTKYTSGITESDVEKKTRNKKSSSQEKDESQNDDQSNSGDE